MKIKLCPICKRRMKSAAIFGSAAVNWWCVNPACGLPAKTCPTCKVEVWPKAVGLGPPLYQCGCGHIIP
jgi:hypothetical protein